jgi:hypothetical protein
MTPARLFAAPAVAAAAILGLSGMSQCSSTTEPAAATTAAAGPERPIPYPVFETKAFARAVEKGTRTRTGTPGPNYWQQYAR